VKTEMITNETTYSITSKISTTPLGIILPQMNANQRKWVDIDSPLSTVPYQFASPLALICG